MGDLTLLIGNKAYSSWSLRAWLALAVTEAPFREIVIPLDRPETRAQILAHSPSGRVPALQDGGLVVWESLAILEYLAERFPNAGLWPSDPAARALARAVSAEMHAGFSALRQHMWMDLKHRRPGEGRTPEVEADITRITAIWRDCRSRFAADGPFLFGTFGNADAMYAPVVTRFQTYGVDLDPVCRAYGDAVLAHPAMQAWTAAALAEPWVLGPH